MTKAEWDLFTLITSTYYGKQYYFINNNGTIYSRASHSNLSWEECVNEFLENFRY